VLDALVSTVILPRIVTGRFCEHTKVREKDRSHEQNQQGIVFPVLVNSRSPRTLKGCIESALYSHAAENDQCVLCEVEQMPGHRFFKFRTLPEVLIVSIGRYEVPPGGKQSQAVVSHAHCEVPDVLELSELLEDEDESRNQIAIYQYAAAVFHWGATMDSGHYVAHVRNKDGNYFLLDDNGRPRVQRSSIKAINEAKYLDLTLVAYVREYKKGKGEKFDPDAEERVLGWWREQMSAPTATPNSAWPDVKLRVEVRNSCVD
jgi:ubiquitin C-terminal hydrolase